MFNGTYTALITPFRDAKLDEAAFAALIDEQAEAGIEGIVPCGSTGESATLSHKEHERVIELAVSAAAGRMKVVAGTGSNNTSEACRLTEAAARAGADGALLISPYYNKPTQAGHIAHYKAVAEASGLPILAYNIPGRTGVNMLPETLAEMAGIDGIVGVKEASGSLDQVQQIMHLAGPDFLVLCGDDSLALAMIAVGAQGIIGVTPNLIPARFKAMIDAALAGDIVSARTMNFELMELMQVMGIETNPIPIKTAMALAGKVDAELRMPLTPMTAEHRSQLMTVLEKYDLVSS